MTSKHSSSKGMINQQPNNQLDSLNVNLRKLQLPIDVRGKPSLSKILSRTAKELSELQDSELILYQGILESEAQQFHLQNEQQISKYIRLIRRQISKRQLYEFNMNRRYTFFCLFIKKSQLICTFLFSILLSLVCFLVYGTITQEYKAPVYFLIFFSIWLIMLCLTYWINGKYDEVKEIRQRLQVQRQLLAITRSKSLLHEPQTILIKVQQRQSINE